MRYDVTIRDFDRVTGEWAEWADGRFGCSDLDDARDKLAWELERSHETYGDPAAELTPEVTYRVIMVMAKTAAVEQVFRVNGWEHKIIELPEKDR